MLTIAFVFFSWILFGATSLAEAGNTFIALFSISDTANLTFTWRYFLTKKIAVTLIIAALGSFGILNKASQMMFNKLPIERSGLIAGTLKTALFVVDILFLINSSYSPFLYFQY